MTLCLPVGGCGRSPQLLARAADSSSVENITRALSRIDAIRSQVGMPAGAGDFQAVLDSRMATGTTDMVAARAVRPPQFVAAAAPAIVPAADLELYLRHHSVQERNGRLERSELRAIGGGWGDRDYSLLPPAATAYEEMRAAAAADGITLQVVDAYRSWEVQAAAYEDYLAGRKNEHVLAPGTSEHGNGLAVDFTNGAIIGTDDAEWRWLQQNGRRFGWYPISNETWHWEFRGLGA